MPRNATGWLGARLEGIDSVQVQNFIAEQARLQTVFNNRLPTIVNPVTRRVMKKGIWRVGKLFWAKSTPDPTREARFNGWTKTKRTTESEGNLQMNCWEAVLYLAYQCDAISVLQCRTFYSRGVHMNNLTNDTNLRNLFGVGAVYHPPGATPNMGDILTCENSNSNLIDHVALYAGQDGGNHYVLHNLTFDRATTGLEAGGSFHFEKVQSLSARYQGNLTIYYTRPFWEPLAPTHNYASHL